MVIQYPHIGTITKPAETVKDQNGDWVQGEPTVIWEGECRAEPNGTGTTIQGEDGQEISFAWNVFFPRMEVEVPRNSTIEVLLGDRVISGLIKRHTNGQLNSRLWV